MRAQVLADKKRARKKERAAAAKLRQRVAMGMEAGPIEVRTSYSGSKLYLCCILV
jgi:hypothetical protein